ncbi:Tetratricopeptide repeat-containing protein trd-1 [Caenorhabditis elegans]|uniref:Tetratricopeptide repeat-containing protein trd-1 n=1 Tax=Caenorhabditis elegans TaxID=6239 RepID=TTC27_CAEEL|nr:Tetratricopeptide repeat-containing protein trd-1 [Caenorhabditis elegans]P41842.2 RecName: Full=Tetratricopeptide repeat-containing protein trd-1; Short=TPR repeat protein 27; AltName: Full=Tetratricopeptide repeat regulator of differentiation protein 1 [Caenorhabditis elegans]CCD69079.1 Tetratricopeptide repeat-containing protein trd-1 [Caenorhabditis elegans]|eukprot:NP_498636.2 Tetratricopeptide repeat-containing protein trd-1 [Caenorhabditis elegans]
MIPADIIASIAGLVNEKDIEKITSEYQDNIWEFVESLVTHVLASNHVGYSDYNTSSFISEELARQKLSCGLNIPNAVSKSLWALHLAHEHVEKLKDLSDIPPIGYRVILEFYLVWQQLLIDPEETIRTEIEPIMEKLRVLIAEENDAFTSEDRCQIQLEMAAVRFQFYEYDKADNLIKSASEECQLNMDLSGMMGKRTRFQQRDIAQLVLIHKDPSTTGTPLPPDSDIPQSLDMNDDTLLEQVAITEQGARVDGRTLNACQLSCLLWIARHESATHRHDVLVHERCSPVLDTVIAARRYWSIQAAALLARAELERGRVRQVDRSCTQSELVVKLQQGVDDPVLIKDRLLRTSYILASGLTPFWQSSVLLAGILNSLGCTSEALLILEKLEMWDGVIDCYKQLGQMDKAETLIRRLIEQKPNDSMLHVYLGDITRNLEYFTKAIELSDDRNARAHRSLGHLLLMDKKFEEAYKHLRRSLELQPIQLGTWFNAGYCAWKLENFKESTQCYHRCVSLQPDHFEAWNNLSAAYIRHGQKPKAWKLLQEALKYNYEHPNVWENYMLLSVDVGEFSQAIQAYHRLLDMNKRGADDEVLELIAQTLLRREAEISMDESEDKAQNEAENRKEKEEMIKLLARISANHQTLSPKTLRVYALLKKPSVLSSETRTEFEKYVRLLEKSLAAANGKLTWPKEEKLALEVVETAVRLAEDRLELAKFIASDTSVKEASAKVRLSLRGILTRLDKDSGSRVSGDETEKLQEIVEVAKSLLDSVAI